MPRQHIELKQRRDIGDTITAFFDFFKIHLKAYINIFIRYNGIFILGFLGVSYLMVTGFVGTMRVENAGDFSGTANTTNEFLIGLGAIGFILLFIVTASMNYSLAASYITNYEKNPEKPLEKKAVWNLVSQNLGRIILFIILMVLLYIPMAIAGFIVGIIPFIGFFGQWIIRFAFDGWMGVSFMSIFDDNRESTDALGEGWRMVMKFFWKSVLVNFVIWLLLLMLSLLVLSIPGFILYIYSYFSAQSLAEITESPLGPVIWTITLSIILVLISFMQSVGQLGNGVLYYSLHEETHNLKARERIEQIGLGE